MIVLPEYVSDCINTLCKLNHTAFCVGGAVRDALLGKVPYDYDIATSATPEEIVSAFPHTVPTGIKHGTVTVVTEGGNIEITTYRTDGDYKDSRHPEAVSFVKNIESDLIRRDFTVNALAFDGKELIDIVGGKDDLEMGIIRAVGEPEKRFSEDALRILRAFRFASTLDFAIEDYTLEGIRKTYRLVENVSVERVAVEFIKLITGKNPSVINEMPSGTLSFIGIDDIKLDERFSSLPLDAPLRFSVALMLNNKDAEVIACRLKQSNAFIHKVKSISEILCKPIPTDAVSLKRLLKNHSPSDIKQSATVREIYQGEESEKIISLLDSIVSNNEPYRIKDLQLGGSDLLELGFDGIKVGEVLEALLDRVIENPDLNKKEALIKLAKKLD